jgi:bifunctional UDP-N-acetylglucosamine pyrophosphorylase/glucosamine-1-phosphate N-acetyltransferase
MSTVALILAAGFGKRMHSATPKVLHQINGDPSLLWVIRALPTEIKSAIVVVNYGKELVQQALTLWSKKHLLPCPVTIVDQIEPLGTGHAVQQAKEVLDQLNADQVLIVCGDVPLVRNETLVRLVLSGGALLAMDTTNPTGYGRILQRPNGSLQSIIEHADASPNELSVKRVNGGIYALPWKLLKTAINHISNNNAKGEYYLTDAIVDMANHMQISVELCNQTELIGMNSRKDQANIQSYAIEQINNYWMDQGVTFLNHASTIVGPRVVLSQDVVLASNVCITGQVKIGSGTVVGQGCVISDCNIGNEVNIKPYCIMTSSNIDSYCTLGPFANLREGTILKHNVRIGNFVEIKNTTLNQGVKANHLSYIGDAEVGEYSNLGAGFITCNYDGLNKHKTIIGKEVFVGSDCQLIAPVTLGDKSIIGAGSTIANNVPPGSLALTRAPLIVKEKAANRIRQRQKKKNQTNQQ